MEMLTKFRVSGAEFPSFECLGFGLRVLRTSRTPRSLGCALISQGSIRAALGMTTREAFTGTAEAVPFPNPIRKSINLPVVMQEREDVVAFEFFAAMQKIEFDHEGETGDLAT